MANSTPTAQWTRFDEPVLGTMAPVYLMEDPATGVIGATSDVSEATHIFVEDTASGMVGVDAYGSATSQLIERNNTIIPVRVPEV